MAGWAPPGQPPSSVEDTKYNHILLPELHGAAAVQRVAMEVSGRYGWGKAVARTKHIIQTCGAVLIYGASSRASLQLTQQ